MNVVSLFDGISCARVALANQNIEIKNYFASEIDNYCICVSKKMWTDIIHVGNVCNLTADKLIDADGNIINHIDLLIGGSPCTDLSQANELRKGLSGEKSKLFYEYLRIKNELNPTYFLFENVCMKQDNRQKITDLLGVEPVEMNSMYFTPQRRKRFFWTNIPGAENSAIYNNISAKEQAIREGKDPKTESKKRLKLSTILLSETDPTVLGKDWKNGGFKHLSLRHYNGILKTYTWQETNPDKPCACLMASYSKQNPHGPYIKCQDSPSGYRLLTAIECERLQGLSDDYTKFAIGTTSKGKPKKISLSQRYKMLGNAFTVPVVEELLKGLK